MLDRTSFPCLVYDIQIKNETQLYRLQSKKLTNEEDIVEKLKSSLEDLSAACILEGFANQDRMVVVDTVIKELGEDVANEPVLKKIPTPSLLWVIS